MVCQYAIPGEYDVPEGCYLFMGDNRANSLDSRCWSTLCQQSPFRDGTTLHDSRSVTTTQLSPAIFADQTTDTLRLNRCSRHYVVAYHHLLGSRRGNFLGISQRRQQAGYRGGLRTTDHSVFGAGHRRKHQLYQRLHRPAAEPPEWKKPFTIQVITMSFLLSVGFIAVFMALRYPIVRLFALGFEGSQLDLAVNLSSVMIASLIF